MAKDQPTHDFVPVLFARGLTEAEFVRGLLVSNDIPAIIEDGANEVLGLPESITGKGVPVLVPDDMLEEARKLLAEQRGHPLAENEEVPDEQT